MPSEIMLVNPARRRRRKTTTKRRRSTKRTTAPRRRRRTTVYAANPRRTRRSKSTHRRSYVRRYRRNRISLRRRGGILGNAKSIVMPAAIGAAGAVGIDALWGYLPIPTNLKTGWLGTAVKVGGILALGTVAGKVMSKRNAEVVTGAAVTVALYQAIRGVVQNALPAVPLGEYPALDFINAGSVIPGSPSMTPPGMQGYISGDMDGYISGLGNYDEVDA